jgi:transposase
VVALEEGVLRAHGRVGIARQPLEIFAQRLRSDDVVVIEATGNAMAVADVLGPMWDAS